MAKGRLATLDKRIEIVSYCLAKSTFYVAASGKVLPDCKGAKRAA